jgi:hypothetical protein
VPAAWPRPILLGAKAPTETEKKFVNWGYGSKGIFATTLYHKKVKAAAAAAAKKSKKKSFSLEILWG